MAGRGGEAGGWDEEEEAPASLFAEEEDAEGGLLLDMLLCYESFHLDLCASRVTFKYQLLDVRSLVQLDVFTTSLALPPTCSGEQHASPDAMAACFAVGMVSLAWLWVGLPCQTILVRAKQLDDCEVAFWNDTLNGCLGEFFQHHGMAPNCIVVKSPPGTTAMQAGGPAPPLQPRIDRRVLVPMGGGKDSTLVWHLLRQALPTPNIASMTWLYVEDEPGEMQANWRLQALAALCGGGEVLVATHCWRCPRWEAIRRRRFNSMGHPWAALVCFTSALVACLSGFDAIVVGNERSAGEGNGMYRGVAVNHQFDKSLDWERRAAAYLARHLGPRLEYFSALSHLWEVQIAARFWAMCPDLLPVITCCNVQHQGTTRPCAECPKCIFVALLFAAVCDKPTQAWAHFGCDPLASTCERVAATTAALLGRPGTTKPLDCVGTADEAAVCVALARQKYTQAGIPMPHLLDTPHAVADAERGALLLGLGQITQGCGPHAVPPWAQSIFGASPELFCSG
jgi:hypothetical protein